MKKSVLILAISSVLALIAGFAPDMAQTESLYQNLTWFFMLVIAILSAVSAFKLLQALDWRNRLRCHWPALLVALVLAGCAALLSPPEFRVLADETNLLGVSLEMHQNMKTRLPLEALYYYDGLREGISYKTEMRPPGYPFALSVLHAVIGYRIANPFILNLGLAWLALLLVYLLVFRYSGPGWGKAAMLLLAAFPAFVQSACSGGFEVYNLVLALALLLLLDLHVAGRASEAPVVSCLLLLSFSRYESVLAILCFIPLLLYMQRKNAGEGSFAKISGAVWAFPVLLVPALWLRRLSYNPAAFQVKDIEEAFSVANFWPNFSGWFAYFTSMDYTRFVGPVMLAVSVVGLILWLRSLADSSRSLPRRLLEASTGLFFLLHLVVRLLYTQGNPINPYTSRLVVIMLPAMVFLAIMVLQRLEKSGSCRCSAVTTAGLALLLLITSWPAVSGSNITNWVALYREFKWVRHELTRLGAGEESILICRRPTMYIPLGYGAVAPKYASEKSQKIMEMLKISAYGRLIFIEAINYKTMKSNMPPIPAEFAGLKSEVVFETQMTEAEKLKITVLTP